MATSNKSVVRPVLLGAYVAKQCARRVHNDWDVTIPKGPWTPAPELQARLEAGIAFEADVLAALIPVLGDRCVDLRGADESGTRMERTVAEMTAGRELIIGGVLPDDPAGARSGRPDLLLRVSHPGEPPTYVPGDVKGHRMVKATKRGLLDYSRVETPAIVEQMTGLAVRAGDRFSDYLQLAHYTRMLQACGFAPASGQRRGFIIGTDDLADLGVAGYVLTWLDLDEALFATFSRSQGSAVRSALERYDHEHGFRVRVAERAVERTGATGDPVPLVVPVFVDECDLCPWHDVCLEELGPDAASVAITQGRLDVREWLALAARGIDTTEDLAAVDVLDGAFWDDYLPEVTHQSKARDRLTTAIRRARMVLAGEVLQRTTSGPILVPAADVEVDFDIEWNAGNRVYLWGALLTDADHPAGEYKAFAEWDALNDADEVALAEQFASWLRERIADAAARGESLTVFHYSHPERTHLSRVLGQEQVTDLLDHFVDLLPIVRANFFGVAGLSIKQTAPAFGFHWRDDDPGGLQSQVWLDQARNAVGSDADTWRDRILAYNEDDVRATAALRAGLRREHG
jgi:predicted RecB family nuclease